MSSDPNSSLSKAILALYALLSIPVIFNVYKHGLRHGAIIGWFFLLGFCTLKLIASGMQLSEPTSTSAAIIGNVGLSPLLLATLGLIHEARAYCIAGKNKLLEIVWVFFAHFVIGTGIALIAVGASGLAKSNNTPDDISSDLTLSKVGAIILLLGWLLMIFVTALSWFLLPGQPRRELPFSAEGKMLLIAVAVATPFLGIRLLTSVVYSFTQSTSLSPVGGSIGLRVGLETVQELLVTIIYIVFGIITRNAGKNSRYSDYGSEQQPIGVQQK